jgi:hypothetical protein
VQNNLPKLFYSFIILQLIRVHCSSARCLDLLFYTNKSYLGRCFRDCMVRIAEKSFLEAALDY